MPQSGQAYEYTVTALHDPGNVALPPRQMRVDSESDTQHPDAVWWWYQIVSKMYWQVSFYF